MMAPALSAGCLACVAALLWADHQGHRWGRVLAKLGASTAFVLVALVLGATGSRYGQGLLLALALGWLGDACLLSRHPQAFLAGLAAFLLSHLAFGAAFLSGAVAWPVLGWALVPAAAVAWGVLRWLMPHTPGPMRWPVRIYVAAVLAMCAAAAGHAEPADRWGVLGGAMLFAVSDLAVARDRFVREAFVNRLWGWPAYFAAQLWLAWSVRGAL